MRHLLFAHGAWQWSSTRILFVLRTRFNFYYFAIRATPPKHVLALARAQIYRMHAPYHTCTQLVMAANPTSVSISGGVQALSNAIAVAIVRQQSAAQSGGGPSTVATGGAASATTTQVQPQSSAHSAGSTDQGTSQRSVVYTYIAVQNYTVGGYLI